MSSQPSAEDLDDLYWADSQWNETCAYCMARCKGKRGVSLHFLTEHFFNFWYAQESKCPICQSDDSGMMHIFLHHRSACLLCLKELSGGGHEECLENVSQAAEEIARKCVSKAFFASRIFKSLPSEILN